jgi:hypothetical protein
MDVGVCGVHRDELSDPNTHWVLENNIDGRVLRIGAKLRELNEYVVLEPPTSARGYGAGRDFSHGDDDGLHIPLSVRPRGKEPETMTLVIPFDKVAAFAEFLGVVAKPHQQDPRRGGDRA